MRKSVFLIAFIFVGALGQTYADTLNVPADFPTIQEAIDAAIAGDTVLVDDGTYTGTGNVDLEIDRSDITLQSLNGPTSTIIDCLGLASGLALTRAAPTVEGFTIRRANIRAISVEGGNTIIRNCMLTDNNEAIGIVHHLASAVITDCMFTGNSTAVACFNLLPTDITNCTFFQTGGIEHKGIGRLGSLNITNCIFANGQTGSLWAIDFRPGTSDASLRIVNSTITGDFAVEGGSIYVETGFVELKNIILWNNLATFGNEIYFADPSRAATITFCDIRGGQEAFGGNPPPIVYENNIDANPLFINAGGGDYHLNDLSPCIGAGTSLDAPTIDIDGNPRGTPPDIGAYENPLDISLPVTLSTFTATPTPHGIQLRWRTESETNNLGFHIYRSPTKAGKYVRITPTLIKGHGTDATPHDYRFIDETASLGRTYYYYIEDVDFSGQTQTSTIIKVGTLNTPSKLATTWAQIKTQ